MAFNDPNSATPALDALTVAFIEAVDGAARVVASGIKSGAGAVVASTQSVAQKMGDTFTIDRPSTPNQTVKEVKAQGLGIEQQATITPENVAAVDSSLGKAGFKAEPGREATQVAAMENFVGTQGVTATLEQLGKPLGISAERDSQFRSA